MRTIILKGNAGKAPHMYSKIHRIHFLSLSLSLLQRLYSTHTHTHTHTRKNEKRKCCTGYVSNPTYSSINYNNNNNFGKLYII